MNQIGLLVSVAILFCANQSMTKILHQEKYWLPSARKTIHYL